jgi:hypothetical protein
LPAMSLMQGSMPIFSSSLISSSWYPAVTTMSKESQVGPQIVDVYVFSPAHDAARAKGLRCGHGDAAEGAVEAVVDTVPARLAPLLSDTRRSPPRTEARRSIARASRR